MPETTPGIAADPPAMLDERDDRFFIDTSTIPVAGLGLFARVPLALGARLEVVGVLVASESVSDRCSHYTDLHKFRMKGALLIPLGYGAMANHAAEPNMERIIDGDRLYLRVLRPVAAGEELFLFYGPDALRRMEAHRAAPR